MRSIWSHGDWAFTLASILALGLFLGLIWLARLVTNNVLAGILATTMTTFLGFKFLIALANLGNVQAYNLTAWFQF
ncbi:MAG: hypothetical protein H0U60_20005 [Blastocatellia bacterium]|nr:hypothetical protein [Blastocatellia bacterium]